MVCEINRLTFDVLDFRRALEIYKGSLSSGVFKNFPSACCGDASQLLASFLIDSGHKRFALISGLRFDDDRPTSHAWLEHNKFIIDITIDQFMDTDIYIISDHTWHNSHFPMQTQLRINADFRNDSDESNVLLYDVYNGILKILGLQ